MDKLKSINSAIGILAGKLLADTNIFWHKCESNENYPEIGERDKTEVEYPNEILNIAHEFFPRRSINNICMDEFPEEYFDPFPSPKIFLNPESDVIEDSIEHTEGAHIDFPSHPTSEKKMILGTYTPMRSPGIITLYLPNLYWFMTSLIKQYLISKNNQRFTITDLIDFAVFVIFKTFYHELFHYGSDIYYKIYNRHYDPLKEEALAVAYAHFRLSRRDKNRIACNSPDIRWFLKEMAFKYTSLGYKDWISYKNSDDLERGVSEYFNLMNHDQLESEGVPVGSYLFLLLSNFIDSALDKNNKSIKIGYSYRQSV